jgi:RimJ/RimL family protein N-acetyltransferase
MIKPIEKSLNIRTETKRLVIRSMRLTDLSQHYADWLNNPEFNKYLSTAYNHQTIESCSAYLQSYEGQTNSVLLGIFLKTNDSHIGNLTLSFIDWYNKSCWVGISIGRKEYKGKGMAKEVLLEIAKYCFDQLDLHRVQAGVNANNIDSLSLFTKCGFKVEGLLRSSNNINGKLEDSYILSVLKTDL